jgi:AAA15 family ATPase/GTPase
LLHAFVGQNNSGKSLVSRIIYACGILDEKRKDLVPNYLIAGASDIRLLMRLIRSREESGHCRVCIGNKELSISLIKTKKPTIKITGKADDDLSILYVPNRSLLWYFAMSSYFLGGTMLFSGQRINVINDDINNRNLLLKDVKQSFKAPFENREFVTMFTKMGIDGTVMDAVINIFQEGARHPEAKRLENRILRGRTSQSRFRFEDKWRDVLIPLQDASSGVQEMWGIIPTISKALQACDMGKKTILMIDEPEVHMHPPALVEIGRWLVEISKKYPKLNLIISTHSDILLRAMTNWAARDNMLPAVKIFGFDVDKKGIVRINEKKIYSEGEVDGIEGFSEAIKSITWL